MEAFHDRFAHFANCGMRNTLADNLDLAGTARHNLAIRHKRSLVATKEQNPIQKQVSPPADPEMRKKIPAGWEQVVAYHNHSELWHVNRMAKAAGCEQPFPHAEVLPADNGERFFSEHMSSKITCPKGSLQHGEHGERLCCVCSTPPTMPENDGMMTNDNGPTPPPPTLTVTNEATQTPAPINNNRNNDCGHHQTCQQACRPTWSTPNTLAVANCGIANGAFVPIAPLTPMQWQMPFFCNNNNITTPTCLLYTSDAADE